MRLNTKRKDDAMVDKIQPPLPITDETLLTRFCSEVAEHIYSLDNKPKQTFTPIEIKDTESNEIKEIKTKINEIVALLNA